MRKIEILIVVAVLLLLAALAGGCKDEAEAIEPTVFTEPDIITIDPNSEIVRNLNILYDPNFYITKCSECGAKVHISKAHWCPRQILRYIPTWPDYIELEKDLVLRYDFPEPNNPLLIHIPTEYRIISEGTKIYFKEN